MQIAIYSTPPQVRISGFKLELKRLLLFLTGHPKTDAAWRYFHSSIESFKAASISSFGSVLYVDLHGQSHDARSQLGYLLRNSDLQQLSQQPFDQSAPIKATVERCSLSGLMLSDHESSDQDLHVHLSQLICGPLSFGAILSAHGVLSMTESHFVLSDCKRRKQGTRQCPVQHTRTLPRWSISTEAITLDVTDYPFPVSG